MKPFIGLSAEARVIVVDEPTAALSGHEVERPFAVAVTPPVPGPGPAT